MSHLLFCDDIVLVVDLGEKLQKLILSLRDCVNGESL